VRGEQQILCGRGCVLETVQLDTPAVIGFESAVGVGADDENGRSVFDEGLVQRGLSKALFEGGVADDAHVPGLAVAAGRRGNESFEQGVFLLWGERLTGQSSCTASSSHQV